MNTMLISLACQHCCRCDKHVVIADWQPFINALPAICWGVLFIVALFFALKYAIKPMIANCREVRLKELTQTHEKEWFDTQSALKKKNEELEKKVQILQLPKKEEECLAQLVKIKEEKENLEKEKMDKDEKIKELEKKALEETVNSYKEIIKHLGSCIH